MLSKQKILASLQSVKPVLEEKYGVDMLALFGSYSRNDATIDSDIDILVGFRQALGIEFIDLAYELEDLLHHKVDLVSIKAIKPKYFEALKEQLIYV